MGSSLSSLVTPRDNSSATALTLPPTYSTFIVCFWSCRAHLGIGTEKFFSFTKLVSGLWSVLISARIPYMTKWNLLTANVFLSFRQLLRGEVNELQKVILSLLTKHSTKTDLQASVNTSNGLKLS